MFTQAPLDLQDEIKDNTKRFHIPEVKDEYLCPVLLSIMKNPITLNCKHTLDAQALKAWEEQKNQAFHDCCPSCRTPIKTRTKDSSLALEVLQFAGKISTDLKGLTPRRYELNALTDETKVEVGGLYIRQRSLTVEEKSQIPGLEYRVKSPFSPHAITTGVISSMELENQFKLNPTVTPEVFYEALKKNSYLSLPRDYSLAILSITSARGHTLCEEFDDIRRGLIKGLDDFIKGQYSVGAVASRIADHIAKGINLASEESAQSFKLKCSIS